MKLDKDREQYNRKDPKIKISLTASPTTSFTEESIWGLEIDSDLLKVTVV